MENQENAAGVNILDDQPQTEAASEAQDPNVVLSQILQGLSGFEAMLMTFDNRIGQLEHFLSYLLMKDPDFKARQEAAEAAFQAQADAQAAANPAPTPETTSEQQA